MRHLLVLLVAALSAAPTIAAVDQAKADSLPPALKVFLEARLAEVNGDYSRALDLYDKAMQREPDNPEIRITYADLLLDVRMVDRALEVLPEDQDLDWYGERTRALVLAQAAAQKPELRTEAVDALEKALAERPDDPTVQLNLAQMLQRLGRLDEADAILTRLRRQRPDNPQLLVLHAGLLRDMGQTDRAAALYRQCVDDPAFASTCRQALVDLLVDRGRQVDAGRAMLGWLADDDLDGLLHAATLLADGGKPDEALPVVRRVLAAQPDSDRARTLEALLLVSTGRLDEAAQRLTALLRESKKDVHLLLTLAWVQARRGKMDDARARVDEAWHAVGENAGSSGGRQVALTAARVELVAGRPLAAREWLEHIAPDAGGGEERVGLLAQTYRATSQWQEGVAALLRLEPHLKGLARQAAVASEAEFRLRLGQPDGRTRLDDLLGADDPAVVLMGLDVLQRLERWPDLAAASERALSRFPGQRDVLFLRGAALERSGQLDAAAEAFKSVLAKDPDDAAAANYLGYMWADAGVHLDEALALIRHAVELEPGNDAYLDSLGWVYYRLGNLAEAESRLRQAISQGGHDGTVLAHLGEVLAARGEREEAQQLLQRALELGTEHAERVRGLLAKIGDGSSGGER